MFAPAMHPAMKHAQAARIELKMRTAFNFLGPLTNPAGPSVQVVGAPSIRAAELVARRWRLWGCSADSWSTGSMDSTRSRRLAETRVLEIRGGAIAEQILTPEDFGVPMAKPEDLMGADKETNRHIALEVLQGARGRSGISCW